MTYFLVYILYVTIAMNIPFYIEIMHIKDSRQNVQNVQNVKIVKKITKILGYLKEKNQ